MKIKFYLRDPDGIWDSLIDAGLDPNDLDDDIYDTISKYIEYMEDICIEIDFESGKAKVVPKEEDI